MIEPPKKKPSKEGKKPKSAGARARVCVYMCVRLGVLCILRHIMIEPHKNTPQQRGTNTKNPDARVLVRACFICMSVLHGS